MAIPATTIDRLPRVKEKVGLGTTSIYKGVSEGWFPAPIHLVGRSVGWLAHEVDAWIAGRIKASREPRARTTPKSRGDNRTVAADAETA